MSGEPADDDCDAKLDMDSADDVDESFPLDALDTPSTDLAAVPEASVMMESPSTLDANDVMAAAIVPVADEYSTSVTFWKFE
ncbi:UNVERIFIED_CONTAM: hypothetical protein ACS92_04195 [Bacillus cereus]